MRTLSDTAPLAHLVDLEGVAALVLNTCIESFAGIDVAVEDDVLRAYQALCFRLFHLDAFLPYQRRGETTKRQSAAMRSLRRIVGIAQDAPYPRDPAPLREALDDLFFGDRPVFYPP